eukprot:GILI01022401.1.p1 GENE.GILI01022401.1~~GILI01022401.1.p1  ORF type:complete len:119 (+),score=21.94 GILI01022401.1:35-391(+)
MGLLSGFACASTLIVAAVAQMSSPSSSSTPFTTTNVTSTTPMDNDIEGPASEASMAFRMTLVGLGALTLTFLTIALATLIVRHRAERAGSKYTTLPTNEVDAASYGSPVNVETSKALQ